MNNHANRFFGFGIPEEEYPPILTAPEMRFSRAVQVSETSASSDAIVAESATGHIEKIENAPARKDEEQNDNTIIHSVAAFLRRFLFLKEQEHYMLIATWILATHLHKRFEYSGYLFAHSPERQSGKTTFLEILNLLVYRPTGLQISPTEAVMFRTAEDHTHLLDEVDSWKNGDDLKEVLNAGYKKGGHVTRCSNSKADYKPKEFPVFAPRALAGIGINTLPPTTLDRTFAVPMVRQKREEKRERFRERKIGPQAKQLKAQIEDWIQKNEKAVGERYDNGDFPYLESFGDRTIDIAEPLVAIVEVAYADHPEAEQAREGLVRAIASTRKEQQAPSREHGVLKRLLELAADDDPLVGNATELAGLCANSEETIDDGLISQTLRRYGFKTKSVRKDGDQPLYRYSLSKASLQELVDRYVLKSQEGG